MEKFLWAGFGDVESFNVEMSMRWIYLCQRAEVQGKKLFWCNFGSRLWRKKLEEKLKWMKDYDRFYVFEVTLFYKKKMVIYDCLWILKAKIVELFLENKTLNLKNLEKLWKYYWDIGSNPYKKFWKLSSVSFFFLRIGGSHLLMVVNTSLKNQFSASIISFL